MSVAIIGDVFLDIITSVGSSQELRQSIQGERDHLTDEIILMPGGSGLNTAVHLKELVGRKLEVRLLSAVGRDEQGAAVEKRLQEMGVRSVLLKDLPNAKTGTCIVLSAEDSRSFITNRGVIDQFQISDFTHEVLRAEVLTSSHIHCAGFFNCTGLGKIDGETVEGRLSNLLDIFREARKRGITTSINPQDDAGNHFLIPPELLAVTTFLIGNEAEIKRIGEVLFISGEYDNELDKTAENVILAAGCQYVVKTLGSRGAEMHTKSPDDGRIMVIAHPAFDLSAIGSSVVDTTGAGDSFIAGFLVAVVEGLDPTELYLPLRVGCAMGAHATTLNGGSTTDSSKLRDLQCKILHQHDYESYEQVDGKGPLTGDAKIALQGYLDIGNLNPEVLKLLMRPGAVVKEEPPPSPPPVSSPDGAPTGKRPRLD